MWTGKTSLPAGQSVCRACRRAKPAPYGPTIPAEKRQRPYVPITEDPYGYEHRARRLELLPKAYYRPCPVCGFTMWPDQRLSLDHSIPLHIDPTSKGDRIIHSRCNSSWASGNDTPPMTAEQRRQRKREQNRKYSARRGSTSARGYGAAHVRERKRWAPIVETGQVQCGYPPCGQIIEPGEPWHLSHPYDDKSLSPEPWHRRCNIQYANLRRTRRQRRAA